MNKIKVGQKVSFNFRGENKVGYLHHRDDRRMNVVFVKRNSISNINDKYILSDKELTKV